MRCAIELLGEVELRWLGEDRVRLASELAAAPGSRLVGAAVDGEPLRVKVHRCVRQGQGFVIEGKLQSPTRALRRLLAERAGA